MRFHAILFVRDEADVIEQSLRHNSKYFDHIYVFDTGSTDGTWEIVEGAARTIPQVIPVRRMAVWFHDGIRAIVFEQFRTNADEGDWWARLDADEFYHDDPKIFVSTLASYETAIYHAYYNFKLTAEEAEVLKDPCAIRLERERPIEQRRRRYVAAFEYSEPRLFQYRRSMAWNPNAYGPYNAGFVARKRISIRHYPHRDPAQMERRCRLRTAMFSEMSKRSPTYHHWSVKDWRCELVRADDPALNVWDGPPAPLVQCTSTTHLPGRAKRFAQWCAHQFALPVLDRLRPHYPAGYRPMELPSSVQKALEAVCSQTV